MLVESKLQIENCGGVSAPQPPAPSLQPRGISLTEVLIAMGIMTVGLLGVASVFPVGTWYMEKAKVADQGSAIAQSVMSDIVARGLLNPGAWLVVTPAPLSAVVTSPNYRYMTKDGKYTSVRAPVPGTFTRPYAETLAEGLKQNPTDPVLLSKQFGNAIVIDPMFSTAAANNSATAIGNLNAAAYAFPACAYAAFPWSGSYYGTRAWDPWRASGGTEKTWPIRRATFQQSNGWPLDRSMAESLCRGSDDLAYDFPQRADRPAMQNWDTAASTSGQIPLARKWTGDYSWIASVVPTTNAGRDGMARNPEGFSYNVSVVVFYKRGMPSTPPTVNSEMIDASSYERAVGAKILSTGTNGGEVLLTQLYAGNSPVDSLTASPFDNLKAGQWIMLCGPHPNSSATEPRFVLNWYQVLSIDKVGAGVQNFNPSRQRVVAVRGPEWPWQPRLSYPSAQQNSNAALLSDDLCAGIFKGAVAVHTKTLRLESPAGGAFGSGTSFITPPGVQKSIGTY
jgi:hypothetical protein